MAGEAGARSAENAETRKSKDSASLFVARAHRVGLTTGATIYRDSKPVMEVRNMFTLRGAQKEGDYLALRLTEGATPEELEIESYHARQGW